MLQDTVGAKKKNWAGRTVCSLAWQNSEWWSWSAVSPQAGAVHR